jgi:hypothetical protein
MGAPRYGSAIGLLNGRIVLAGGTNESAAALASAESYDPTTDTWTAEPDMPGPMTAFAGAVIGDYFYVAGGSSLETVTSTVERFAFGNPASCPTGATCN